jgi:glutathione S-transferase
MADFTIVLGNKSYSSWSLRAWLVLKRTGAAFDEVVIPLDRPESKAAIQEHSPAGRVPVLRHGQVTVWDTMAITEYLNERFPAAGLWPGDEATRAHARTISAEMHAGFATLRVRMPMDLRRDPVAAHEPAPGGALGADIARVIDIWQDARARFGGNGDFLFGDFCAADAFYAPVVTRFVTYGVALEGAAAAYRDAIMAWPAMRAWVAAAKAEPWVIEYSKL